MKSEGLFELNKHYIEVNKREARQKRIRKWILKFSWISDV